MILKREVSVRPPFEFLPLYISYILSTPFFVPTEKNDSRVIGVFADLSKDALFVIDCRL